MVGAAGKRVEAERAEQHRQHQRVAGIFVEMRFGGGHGEFGLALDHGGHDLDMLAFARTGVGGQLPGMRGHGAGLGSLHIELMQAGARDMRQREIRDLRAIARSKASSAPCQADSMQSTPSR